MTAPNSAPSSPEEIERRRLSSIQRYVETTTKLPGSEFKIPDGPSFLAVWNEVIDKEIYRFKTSSKSPRILDCGANVGVSCLYFRKQFPTARITAFEPDPKIFAYLKRNLTQCGLADIELIAKGVWSSTTTLRFQPEGSDAGRISARTGKGMIEIQTVRLRDYLEEDIDFLKIDIEGAETEVISDAEPCLNRVKNLFVEYHSFEGQPQTIDKLLHSLSQAGFRVQIHPIIAAPKPFIEVKSYLGMDLQLNIFAYRDCLNS